MIIPSSIENDNLQTDQVFWKLEAWVNVLFRASLQGTVLFKARNTRTNQQGVDFPLYTDVGAEGQIHPNTKVLVLHK